MKPLPLASTIAAARRADPIPVAAGIGLRFPHHDLVITERPTVAWFEVHPENYLGAGPPAQALGAIRRDYPVSLHATGLSLGSAEGLDLEHLADIASLARRIQPGLISDHLSWSAAAGLHLPDLLPLPYTEEALAMVARNLDQTQGALGRQVLVENPSTYLQFADCSLTEAEFLGELVQRSGCGVLLDINNVFVTASNLGEDPHRRLAAMLEAIPAASIGEIHLAGHAVRELDGGGVIRIDDHGAPVCPEVWALFEAAIARIGPRPTLIEWDTAIPDFAVLQGEAALAQTRLDATREAPRHALAG
ncbi:MAG: DUF692 domain-containing protein [Caulobacteraceae bacterium]